MSKKLRTAQCWLLVLVATPTACGPLPNHDQAIGYSLWPDVRGRLSLHDKEGRVLEQFDVPTAFGAEEKCGASTIDLLSEGQAEWEEGSAPWFGCSGPEDVGATFGPQDESPPVSWPDASGTYRGSFSVGRSSTEVDYDIFLEEDRGELTPLPHNLWVRGLEPATSDYRRRFTIAAEVDCAEHALPCTGIWSLALTYDVPRARVSWLYPITE